uniref:Uncharacterized protein n=1 Tax=Anopheles merus TaxID=30066 RepID=A0A182V6S6_ANOME
MASALYGSTKATGHNQPTFASGCGGYLSAETVDVGAPVAGPALRPPASPCRKSMVELFTSTFGFWPGLVAGFCCSTMMKLSSLLLGRAGSVATGAAFGVGAGSSFFSFTSFAGAGAGTGAGAGAGAGAGVGTEVGGSLGAGSGLGRSFGLGASSAGGAGLLGRVGAGLAGSGTFGGSTGAGFTTAGAGTTGTGAGLFTDTGVEGVSGAGVTGTFGGSGFGTVGLSTGSTAGGGRTGWTGFCSGVMVGLAGSTTGAGLTATGSAGAFEGFVSSVGVDSGSACTVRCLPVKNAKILSNNGMRFL